MRQGMRWRASAQQRSLVVVPFARGLGYCRRRRVKKEEAAAAAAQVVAAVAAETAAREVAATRPPRSVQRPSLERATELVTLRVVPLVLVCASGKRR